MPDLRLYLVTDRAACLGRPLTEVVGQAVQGGVTLVQLREKQAGTREFVELTRGLLAVLRPLGVPLLVNDRVDVALAAGADGVHLGQTDMRYADARRILGPEAIIGLTISREADLEREDAAAADYLGVGPVFPTRTKPDHAPPWGVEGLARAARLARRPFVAIGAVTALSAADCVRAGAAGVAVVSAVCGAPDPAQAARELRAAVAEGQRG